MNGKTFIYFFMLSFHFANFTSFVNNKKSTYNNSQGCSYMPFQSETSIQNFIRNQGTPVERVAQILTLNDSVIHPYIVAVVIDDIPFERHIQKNRSLGWFQNPRGLSPIFMQNQQSQ